MLILNCPSKGLMTHSCLVLLPLNPSHPTLLLLKPELGPQQEPILPHHSHDPCLFPHCSLQSSPTSSSDERK